MERYDRCEYGPHRSLDIDNRETPSRAFHNIKATDAIRKRLPKRMEADADD